MGGRPSIYTQELAAKICGRLANGESLRSICNDDDMPARQTVFEWAFTPSHPFSDQYEKARDMQADSLADDLQSIADDGTNDYMVTQFGVKANNEHIQRSRLRVDTRKWIASKLKPKRYGDKTAVEHSGSISLESLISGTQDKPE